MLRMLLAASLLVAGCKGPDRKEVCRVALETFDKEWSGRMDAAKDEAQKKKMQTALERMRAKFTPYCESASEFDLDCIQKGANIAKDPACKAAFEALRKIIAPAPHDE